MENVRLIASIQHTGTSFLVDLLKNHPDFDELRYERHLDQPFDEEKFYLVHTHMHGGGYDRTNSLIKKYKTVIPVRDPMLSLISRQNRFPRLKHNQIVYGFEYIAKLEDVFFYPIDLYKKQEDREKLTSDCFDFLGISYLPYAQEIIKNWQPVGSFGRSKLKNFYRRGRLSPIRRHIRDEYKLLKEKQPIIQPFLEKLGYKRLRWWKNG